MARDWVKEPLRISEHIAADVRAGRFPGQSSEQQAMDEIDAALLDHGEEDYCGIVEVSENDDIQTLLARIEQDRETIRERDGHLRNMIALIEANQMPLSKDEYREVQAARAALTRKD